MLETIDHHELAAIRQERDHFRREAKYKNAQLDNLKQEITHLRSKLLEAYDILSKWAETCAQICADSYELSVQAKELRYATPCATDMGEVKSTKSIDIVEIENPQGEG